MVSEEEFSEEAEAVSWGNVKTQCSVCCFPESEMDTHWIQSQKWIHCWLIGEGGIG